MNRMFLAGAALCFAVVSQAWATDKAGPGFMERWDQDGDGKVTVEEAEARRKALFENLDTNKDGFIDTDEYKTARLGGQKTRSAVPQKNQEKRPDDIQVLMDLAENDKDGDGKVSPGEFMSNSGTWVDMMDGNKDGAVTVEEFETKWHDRDSRIKLLGG